MGKKEEFRDRLYTIGEGGKRNWVYPELATGKFFKARLVVAYILMLIYLLAPWIKISGKPLILLNLVERKFTFFGVTFWATDTIFLMILLTSLGLTLFFVTALFGRIWCGWACPETVFLEFLFRPIERLIEGSPVQRRKLDSSPMSMNKFIRKALKHGISATMAAAIANTALAYFIGSNRLLEVMTNPPSENLALFSLMIFMMFAMAFQFGWFREQFCTVVCPYARFQSVMLDVDSLVVGYDPLRGEPRGKKGTEGAGDCVDCKMCVRVCPTGIDIRNGLQLECINCTQCIDACDSIMEKLGRPLGLIRYDTERQLTTGIRKFIRPRLFVYSFILILYAGAFIYFLKNRTGFDLDLIREAHSGIYQIKEDGRITNQFKLRLSNKTSEGQTFNVKIELENKEDNIEVILPLKEFKVESSQIFDMPIFIFFDKSVLGSDAKKGLVVRATSDNGDFLEKNFTLIGPK